jgi:hypothetical protein
MRVHQPTRERVQLDDIAAAEGDHHIAGDVLTRGAPPVGEQSGSRRERVVRDEQAIALVGEGEVIAAEPVSHRGESLALEFIVLTAVLRLFDRSLPFDDAREETTGANSGQLVWIADQ